MIVPKARLDPSKLSRLNYVYGLRNNAVVCLPLLIFLGLLVGACAPEVVRRNNAGNEAFYRGAYAEALAEYRQAQVDDPDRAEPYYNAANAYNLQSQVDATLAQTQQALRNAETSLAAATWYNLGNAYYDAGSWVEAIAAYQEALRIDPDDRDAKHNLELALRRLEQQQEQEKQQQRRDQQQQQEGEERHQEEHDQEDRGAASQEPPEMDAAMPKAENQTEVPENQDQEPEERQGSRGLTPEAARQLLQALIDSSETLQERLQQIYRVPGPPPEQDW